jgi:oligoendopeptidase F
MSKQTLGVEEVRWDLSDLFSGLDDPALDTVLIDADKKADSFVKSNKGRLGSLTSAELRRAHGDLIAITGELYRSTLI